MSIQARLVDGPIDTAALCTPAAADGAVCLFLGVVRNENPDIRVRQFFVAGNPSYQLPLLFMTIGNCVPQTVPYYGADKPIKGYVPGSAGAAMLEKLIGFPGDGTIRADLNDLAGIATVFFLILGNLSYFGKKYFEKKEVN